MSVVGCRICRPASARTVVYAALWLFWAIGKLQVPSPTATPLVFPILSVVAAPAKLIVVAVVLSSANVVDVVISGETTEIPAANGIEDVAVCDPSLSKHVERAVDRSLHVL